jgi:hypothetical protein
MSEKNPHNSDTPEWQLWENMQSSLLQATAHAQDAERSTKKAGEARDKADRYKAALEKLARS